MSGSPAWCQIDFDTYERHLLQCRHIGTRFIPAMSFPFKVERKHVMYEQNRFVDFKHGRAIYGPGDQIHNLKLSPFGAGDAAGGGAAECRAMTQEPWLSEGREEMIRCMTGQFWTDHARAPSAVRPRSSIWSKSVAICFVASGVAAARAAALMRANSAGL